MTRRLNWGCGPRGEPGWVNSDRKQGPSIDVSGDIRDGLPVADDTFDYAVSIHALSMIPYPDVVPALGELGRVVAPGGWLRLGLPDLDRAISAYRCGRRDHFLVPDEDAATLGGKMIVHLLWYGHNVMLFTMDWAEELLVRAGFAAVHPSAYRQTASPHPDIVALDNREHESLFIEAVVAEPSP